MTGLAIGSLAKNISNEGMSSPGGEETGEGELKKLTPFLHFASYSG
jgi:hypothetical protein